MQEAATIEDQSTFTHIYIIMFLRGLARRRRVYGECMWK
jgi:allantoicase